MSGETAIPGSASSLGRRLAGVLSDLWYLFWKLAIWAIYKVCWRIRIEGREHEPVSGPFIAACNHASAVDPPLVGIALRHRASYMGKEELFSIPVLSAWLASVGTFPVRRGHPDRKAIRHSLRILEGGGVLVMFPEGTRSPDGRLKDPESGAAMLALRTGAPVLPVALINTHRILPRGAKWPRFERVTIRFGPPIAVPRVEGRLDERLLEEWGGRIMAEIAKLLPEDQKPGQLPPRHAGSH